MPVVRYAVEVRLASELGWKRMRHLFDDRAAAERIKTVALGAQDTIEARVVEVVGDR